MPALQVQSQTASGSGTTLSVTLPNPVTLGNRIIVLAAARGAGVAVGAIAPDTLGNVYHQDIWTAADPSLDPLDPNAVLLEDYSAQVSTAGVCTITYTVPHSGSVIQLVAMEWSGLFSGTNYTGQTGAAYVDYGTGAGSAPFPPLTLYFSTDQPALAAYYGHSLPLLAMIAVFDTSIHQSDNIFPVAQNSVTLNPGGAPFTSKVLLIVLYVASGSVGTANCCITVAGGQCNFLDLWVWRQLWQFSSLTENVTLPPAYEKAIKFSLAVELAREYPNRNPALLLQRAQLALQDMERVNASVDTATEDALPMTPPDNAPKQEPPLG